MRDSEMIEELDDIIQFDPAEAVKDSAHSSHCRCLWLSNPDYIQKLLEENEAIKEAELTRKALIDAKKADKVRKESEKDMRVVERKEKKERDEEEKKRKIDAAALRIETGSVKVRNVKVKCDNSLCNSTCLKGDSPFSTWSKCSKSKCKKMFCSEVVCGDMQSGLRGHINFCQS